MNKLERNISKKNHFIKRIKLLKDKFYSNSFCGLLDGPGCQRKHANWMNLIWDTCFNCYRTTGSPVTDKLSQLRYDKKDRISWKNHFDSELLNV